MATILGVLAILVHLNVYFCQEPLIIGAFNIKTFGRSKMSDPIRASRIAQITSRYDIMLLQEIRDSSGNSVRDLLKILETYGNYEYVISGRLGRTSYKEQYAFIYKSDTIKIIDTYQFDDGVDDRTDAFEREPFSVLAAPTNSCIEFAMIALHSKPTAAIEEIDALDDVRKSVEVKWNTKNIMIMGDLNADCSYASRSKLANLKLRINTGFIWWIDSTQDTTTGSSNCAYDRIITKGDYLNNNIIKASVYRFDQTMELTPAEMSSISDHYPVESQLFFSKICDPCSQNTKLCSNSVSPQFYCTCFNGRTIKKRCKHTEIWNETYLSCRPICRPFQNTAIPHPTECKKYIQCFWGFPVVFDCLLSSIKACQSCLD